MTEVSVQIKTHVIRLYGSEEEYYITQEQYDKIMQLSATAKGITLENEYIAFGSIEKILELPQPQRSFFSEMVKYDRPNALASFLKGLDQAIKEAPGSYKLCKPETVELRKRIAKRVEELQAV